MTDCILDCIHEVLLVQDLDEVVGKVVQNSRIHFNYGNIFAVFC